MARGIWQTWTPCTRWTIAHVWLLLSHVSQEAPQPLNPRQTRTHDMSPLANQSWSPSCLKMFSYHLSQYIIPKNLFFSWWELEIYSFNNFQIRNRELLTGVSMLYIVSPRLIYFITGNLYILTHLTSFPQLPISFLYLWAHCFVCLFILHSTYKFISGTIRPPRFTHVVANGRILLFLKKILFTYFQRGQGRGKERDRNMWSHMSPLETWPQPGHVPWPEIEPATFRFTGGHSIHWATPARALLFL